MSQLKISVLKDSDRYFGDIQREARRITNTLLNNAKRKFGVKAKPIHPEKAIRLAKKNVASNDHVIVRNIDSKYAADLTEKDITAMGYDISKGRRFVSELVI